MIYEVTVKRSAQWSLERLDDLEDRLSVHETAGEEDVPLAKVRAGLGL